MGCPEVVVCVTFGLSERCFDSKEMASFAEVKSERILSSAALMGVSGNNASWSKDAGYCTLDYHGRGTMKEAYLF